MEDKLYVITRTDLSKSQQAVQAGHALAEFMLNCNLDHNRYNKWENGTLVYLKVKDEVDLKCLTHELNYARIEHIAFEEPDINNQLTAIASLGTNKFFERMRLL